MLISFAGSVLPGLRKDQARLVLLFDDLYHVLSHPGILHSLQYPRRTTGADSPGTVLLGTHIALADGLGIAWIMEKGVSYQEFERTE